jgi:hypothetical protein
MELPQIPKMADLITVSEDSFIKNDKLNSYIFCYRIEEKLLCSKNNFLFFSFSLSGHKKKKIN